jgi:phenylacetate-CoA ligase
MNPSLHRLLIHRPALLWRGESATWRLIEQKRTLERVGTKELAQHVEARLARMLHHAARNVPFYQRLWGEALLLAEGGAFEMLSRLPFVSKRDLQDRAPEMRARGTLERVWTKTTGGSTAEPVTVWKNARGMAEERAATWAALAWSGLRPSDRVARFWSTPLTTASRRRFRFADIAMNRIRLSAFDLTDEDLAQHWRNCLEFRPSWLYGYSSMIDLLARWVEDHGEDGRALRLTAVIPTSEPLDDAQRERMTRVFGCTVQNEYGCGEVGAIAYDCERGLLHVMADNVVCEVLRDDGAPAASGETGELVLTDLTNFAMPLVRYRLGDRVEAGGVCSCGRSFPTLSRVVGRTYDEVFTPSGRRWNGWQMHYFLSTLMGQRGGFRQYQVIQNGPDTLEVRLVSDGDPSEPVVRAIESYVFEQLDGMRATVRRVDKIERSKSGKLQVVRNDWRPGAETTSTD